MQNDLIRMRFDAHMSAEKPQEAELLLYGEIISDMPENWKFSKEDKSAAEFNRAVQKLKDAGVKTLNLRINSPGGIVNESVAMRSTLINAGFDKINIRIEGWCASAATHIATIPGAYVEIAPGSEYMIHNPWAFVIGNANDMEREAQHMRQLEENSAEMYAKRTGQDKEQIRAWMDAETWFSPADAVKYGFCDKVCDEEKQDNARMSALSRPMMSAVRSMYAHAPQNIAELAEEAANTETTENLEAGFAVGNKNKEVSDMDIKNLTLEQLQAENPALLQQIQESAVNAERQRVKDIDEATDIGCESIAKQAVQEGKSVVDFVKMQVAHKREKAAAEAQKAETFLQKRVEETAPAQEVAAAVPAEEEEDADEKAYLQMAAAYATETAAGGMF